MRKNNAGNPAAILACQDPANLFNSAVALDLATGAVKWAMRASSSDAWKGACLYFGLTCPDPEGPDFDFGAGANLFTANIQGTSTDVVGAGQKSGNYWALNPDTGAVLWISPVGPGGKLGGIQWGTAVDGQRIYVAIANSTHAVYTLPSGNSWNGASWAALRSDTGEVIWQARDPGLDPVQKGEPAIAMGPVTVANGVVYAPSMSGKVYALSAATGATLWSYDTGASVNAGAAIVNGTVYWGSGYSHFGVIRPVGTSNNKFSRFRCRSEKAPRCASAICWSYMVLAARLQNAARAVKRWFRRKPPEDSYAYVGAPKKPITPHLRASAAAKRPEF